MAENTAIEWTDHTFNPWEGCQKVSPACDRCYAEARNARYNGGAAPNWGPGAPRRRTAASNWKKPLAWQRKAEAFREQHHRRQRVFCASLADVFDNAVPAEWRADLLDLLDRTPDLDWLLLTKRIGNTQAMVEATGRERLPHNVWLGATVVSQDEAARDIPKLGDTPARVRFLSMEPLLGPVDLEPWIDSLDWIIVGGESGGGVESRPLHPAWVKSLRDQCATSDTPFLFKQWGDWLPAGQLNRFQVDLTRAPAQQLPGGKRTHLIGKKHAGRHLDRREHTAFPVVA